MPPLGWPLHVSWDDCPSASGHQMVHGLDRRSRCIAHRILIGPWSPYHASVLKCLGLRLSSLQPEEHNRVNWCTDRETATGKTFCWQSIAGSKNDDMRGRDMRLGRLDWTTGATALLVVVGVTTSNRKSVLNCQKFLGIIRDSMTWEQQSAPKWVAEQGLVGMNILLNLQAQWWLGQVLHVCEAYLLFIVCRGCAVQCRLGTSSFFSCIGLTAWTIPCGFSQLHSLAH